MDATTLAIILFSSCMSVSGYLDHSIPRDGIVTSPAGYPGTTYQSIRYEPLCGTLGVGYGGPVQVGHCGAVMDAYSNNTDTLAFYDETGVRLKGAVVGGGRDLCMCFSLSTVGGTSSDMCWWFNGYGQTDIWWRLDVDYIIGGFYRPGSAKSLPQCSSIDLDAAKAAWSATAVMPGVTESVISVGGRTVTTTFTPSVVSYTTAIPTTFTGADGRLTTSTATYTSQLPVVTVQNSDQAKSNRIALGVGLGIGIPSLILMVIGLCQRVRIKEQQTL